jgi:predicted metal-dependent phosphoesterase TrpH
MAYIDLHMHTDCSDGACTAEEVLSLVRSSGIVAFSITDHDTLDGAQQVRTMLVPGDPELVTGVELSAHYGSDDLHILAYLFDPDNDKLVTALTGFREMRMERGKKIIEKLRDLGVDVWFDSVEETADGSVIGRPHVAETLHRLNKVGSYQDAFDKYIGRSGPAYVPKIMLTPQEAIDLVHHAGGVAVLAHPFIDNVAKHLDMLIGMGLDGIEVRHSNHLPEQMARLERIAMKQNLVMSGGSDFHGREGRHGMIGSQRVPAEYLDRLKQRSLEVRGKN